MTISKKAAAAKKPARKTSAARVAKPAPRAAAEVVKTKPSSAMPATAKPVAAKPPLPAMALSKPAPEKPAKPKKPKLVRDSFTIPKAEYLVLDALKDRAGKMSSPAKKSELLRAGIKALAAMPDGAFLAALQAVPAIKTGRPRTA